MKVATIVLNHPTGTLPGDLIGVEQGAVYLASSELEMTLACGDFDSVSEQEKTLIQAHAKTFVQLNPEKDQTDFEAALSYCQAYDVIYVYGALGRRIDHEMVNLLLAHKDPRIVLLDENNRIQAFEKGEHVFQKNEYQYFSIIPLQESIISLEGFKYDLFKRRVEAFDTYLSSNEIIDTATLTVFTNRVLVVQSNDTKDPTS